MNAYIITYDLSQPGRNYDNLYERIKSYSSWARITESSWTLASEQNPVQIRDYLNSALDTNDKIFVGRLGDSAWIGLSKEVSDWLKTNI